MPLYRMSDVRVKLGLSWGTFSRYTRMPECPVKGSYADRMPGYMGTLPRVITKEQSVVLEEWLVSVGAAQRRCKICNDLLPATKGPIKYHEDCRRKKQAEWHRAYWHSTQHYRTNSNVIRAKRYREEVRRDQALARLGEMFLEERGMTIDQFLQQEKENDVKS